MVGSVRPDRLRDPLDLEEKLSSFSEVHRAQGDLRGGEHFILELSQD